MRVTNLVTGSVSQAGEQRGELATDCGIDVLPEDNLLESGSAGDLSRILSAIDTFSFVNNPNLTRVWLLINRLAVVSTYGGCQCLVVISLESEKVVRDGRSSTQQYRQSLEESQVSNEFCVLGTSDLPEPRRRAVADSFLTSLEAAPALEAIAGDMFSNCKEIPKKKSKRAGE